MDCLQDSLSISFRELERKVFQEGMRWCSEVMAKALEALDEQVKDARDTDRYEILDQIDRELDTMVGKVEFERRYYSDEKTGENVFLLDELLGLESGSKISPELRQVGITQSLRGPSYRKAAETLTDIYGYQVVSHETLRQSVIALGEEIKQTDKRRRSEFDGPRKEVDLLYIEADGLWLSLQGEEKKSQEVHMAMVHEGWQKRHPLSDNYDLVGQKFYQGFTGGG